MNLHIDIIEKIHEELQYGSNSITNILRSKYPSLSPYIYDITNAYFQYTHKKIIEKDINTDLFNTLQKYIVDNNYHTTSIISRKTYDNIIRFIKNRGYDKFISVLNDLIFLIFIDYDLVPIYDHNIVYTKFKY
jgi:hypothetical protein